MLIHVGMASRFDIQELALDADDANDLSKSIVNVMDQYDIVVDPKTMALIGLAVTSSKIYGAKFMIYKMRVDAEREANAIAVT